MHMWRNWLNSFMVACGLGPLTSSNRFCIGLGKRMHAIAAKGQGQCKRLHRAALSNLFLLRL